MRLRRIAESASGRVTIRFDGRPLDVVSGQPLATALLMAGVERFNETAKDGTARMPYCLAGACFDCRLVVDGARDVQACLVPVRDGMDVRFQGRDDGG